MAVGKVRASLGESAPVASPAALRVSILLPSGATLPLPAMPGLCEGQRPTPYQPGAKSRGSSQSEGGTSTAPACDESGILRDDSPSSTRTVSAPDAQTINSDVSMLA